MDPDQNWYRQLAALVLLSASRAAVEFITNPSSRDDAGKQLKSAFASIDYDALAQALARQIDSLADTSKATLSDTIDTLRDTGLGAVEQAKSKAQKTSGQKRGGRKLRFLFGLIIGGVIAYFLMDEQRRDDLLDRMTGASGPISPPQQSFSPPPASTPSPAPAPSTPASSGNSSTGSSGSSSSSTPSTSTSTSTAGTTEKETKPTAESKEAK